MFINEFVTRIKITTVETNQIANILPIVEKAREFQKKSASASLTTLKTLCVSQQTVKNSSRNGNTRPFYLPLRKLCAGQEATARTRHETMNWFKIGKAVLQDSILSPCLFNLYAEYIMWSAWLDEAQAVIKIAWRNIDNLKYADDTTLMAESEEELNILLKKVKEESGKSGLKLNIQKNEDHGIWSHHFMANRWRNNENSVRLYFLGLQNHCRWWLQPWN